MVMERLLEHQALQELLVPEAGVEPARRVNGTGF
jgi:hypothetical protein